MMISDPVSENTINENMETQTMSDPNNSSSSMYDYESTMSTSLIDPPSYSDATSSPTASPNPNSEYLSISISDPRKENDSSPTSLVPGAATHVTYLITTKTRSGSVFQVRRRFRDFVTLGNLLSEGYRGFFVPVRPDKNSVESQVMDQRLLVDQRKFQLDKYLSRLARHPVIGKSDEVRLFLTVDGKMPLVGSTDMASRMLDGVVKLPRQLVMGEGVVVEKEEIVILAKGGRDLLRIFKELKQSVSNEWGGGAKVIGVEEDKEFFELKEKVGEFEQQLVTASQRAEVLVKAQQDIEESMGQLGMAFIKLVKLETDEAFYESQKTRAADAKLVATAAVKASRLYRELNSQTVKHLDTLHEYLGLMLAIRNAFSDRANALLTAQTLASDLSNLQTKAEKLEVASSKIFHDESRVRKLDETRKIIRATEDNKSIAIREYERIKDNNKYELERLDVEKHNDFLDMLKGFVTTQVLHSEKIANVWAKVAEETRHYANEI